MASFFKGTIKSFYLQQKKRKNRKKGDSESKLMIERGEATEKTKIEKEEKTKGQTERNTNNKVSL